MRVVRLNPATSTAITAFKSSAATSMRIANGAGEAHVYWIAFEPGGVIGPHEAGFGQLFVPVEGTGWVAGPDGQRQPVSPGDGAVIARGEVHSKGSNDGMTALMLQVRDLEISYDIE